MPWQKQGELHSQGLCLLPGQTPLLLPLLPRLTLVLLLRQPRSPWQRQPRASGDPNSAYCTTSYLSSLRWLEHRHKHRHKHRQQHRQPEPRCRCGERRLSTSSPHQLVLRYSWPNHLQLTLQLVRLAGFKTEKTNKSKKKKNPCTPLILTLASRECPRSGNDKHIRG